MQISDAILAIILDQVIARIRYKSTIYLTVFRKTVYSGKYLHLLFVDPFGFMSKSYFCQFQGFSFRFDCYLVGESNERLMVTVQWSARSVIAILFRVHSESNYRC